MEKSKIKLYGDPVLRKKAQPVKKIDDRIRTEAAKMLEIMRKARGVGLAANQVGLLDRLCVIDTNRGDTKGEIYTLLNPVIIRNEGKLKVEEGCLSFPELCGEVERPAYVRVRAVDLEGREFEADAEGLLARALQHEIDHLDGVLFIDYLSFAKKLLMKKELDALKKLSKKR
ncbi:MAG: peptide deformylase [Candidatus Firestonebacteria bacterium]